ncbi:carbonic anhydrase [Methanococcus voltae]|uniref:beta-class carbonic anhydrase n=1 Tax=Methanococcus voltae TaxID=2188 RepID=UPI001FD921B1|nr:carbonic anhydrase [Methanococcus voltae]MBP2144112.1 carbonic anhydrase [Methanococcus voltae]
MSSKGETIGAEARPKKKLAVVTCMDTRLVNFLNEKMGLERGDAKVIKNAGNIITEDALRSLVVAIYCLGAEKIAIVGHTDCGMAGADTEEIKNEMIKRGANPYFTTDFDAWIGKMDDEEENVKRGVELVKNHPAIPKDVEVEGLIIDIVTGEITKLV